MPALRGAMQFESRSVSRILYTDFAARATIIHLAHPLPNGSSDLPEGRSLLPERSRTLGGQPCVTPPYLVLHCEEFAWPRRVATRAGALLH